MKIMYVIEAYNENGAYASCEETLGEAWDRTMPKRYPTKEIAELMLEQCISDYEQMTGDSALEYHIETVEVG